MSFNIKCQSSCDIVEFSFLEPGENFWFHGKLFTVVDNPQGHTPSRRGWAYNHHECRLGRFAYENEVCLEEDEIQMCWGGDVE